jgi:hypothetical protein
LALRHLAGWPVGEPTAAERAQTLTRAKAQGAPN